MSEEAKSLEAEAYRGSEASLSSPRRVASPVHQVASPVHRGSLSPASRNVASPGSRSRRGY